MLFLIVVLCLSFVACFPLSEKDRHWPNFLRGKTHDTDLNMESFGRQILDGDQILRQLESAGKQSNNVREQESTEKLTVNILDTYNDESNKSHALVRHKRQYSMSFSSVHSKLTPYLDPNFDPFYNAHVMPCSYDMRNYCLNNGVCAVVVALDIITCRCPVQYTGKRCEIIDSDFFLALFGF